jgi:hypothetical protein
VHGEQQKHKDHCEYDAKADNSSNDKQRKIGTVRLRGECKDELHPVPKTPS